MTEPIKYPTLDDFEEAYKKMGMKPICQITLTLECACPLAVLMLANGEEAKAHRLLNVARDTYGNGWCDSFIRGFDEGTLPTGWSKAAIRELFVRSAFNLGLQCREKLLGIQTQPSLLDD